MGEGDVVKTRYARRPVEPVHSLEFQRFSGEWSLEELRQALRRELRTHSGQLALARFIGVGRTVIRKFVEMRSVPRGENLERLREWAADRPFAETPAGAVAFALLVGDLPSANRYQARLTLAEALIEHYAAAGQPVPEWLVNEVADRRRA